MKQELRFYFPCATVARFPAIVHFLAARVTPKTRASYVRLIWDIIDSMRDPDTAWHVLACKYLDIYHPTAQDINGIMYS